MLCPTLLLLFAVSARAQYGRLPGRLCLAPASVQMSGVSPDQALDAVRETFIAVLAGPSLDVVPLTARTPSQVREEAQLAGCAATLFVTLRHRRKQRSGLLGRVASDALQEVSRQAPTGGIAGSVARAASDAAADAARALSASTQARDELTLEYRLERPDGGTAISGTDRRKASADGEDLLTPLVEQAAARITEALLSH